MCHKHVIIVFYKQRNIQWTVCTVRMPSLHENNATLDIIYFPGYSGWTSVILCLCGTRVVSECAFLSHAYQQPARLLQPSQTSLWGHYWLYSKLPDIFHCSGSSNSHPCPSTGQWNWFDVIITFLHHCDRSLAEIDGPYCQALQFTCLKAIWDTSSAVI